MKHGLSAPTFTARYHGRCGNCDNAIEPGDEATYSDDEVVHAGCAGDAPAKYRQASSNPVCTQCWLEHPKGAECP